MNTLMLVQDKIITTKHWSHVMWHLSVPPGIAIHKPAGRALVGEMPSPTTVVANQQGAHAISAHMTKLLAVATHNVSITTAASSTSSPLSMRVAFGALSSNMPRYIARVADGVIRTFACQVTGLPTVVACLFVRAISSNMTLLIAVVAQSQVPGWHWWSCALSSTVSSLTTGMADAFVWATVSHVAWFSAVPAQWLRGAFWSNVPDQFLNNIVSTMQLHL